MPAKSKDESPALSDDVRDAIAETVAEQRTEADVELNGEHYKVNLQAFRGLRFRLAMQKNQDMVAMEMILGAEGLERLIATEGDELDTILRFIDALGKATGSGNS